MRILVVQHAEKERTPGDPGLTPTGHEQARRVAARLAGTGPVALWTSPLRRAQETAAPIAAALGLDVVVEPRLRERMNWDGSQPFDDFLADWQHATADRSFVPRTGDSSLAAAARFLAGLADLAQLAPDATAIVVAHGGVTTDALRTVLGDAGLHRRSPTLLAEGIPPCALTTFTRTSATWTIPSLAAT
jgi:broad specificity phosphatase PhoE